MDHRCKQCSKSFPCGRSLGGHMRSHVSSTCPPYSLRDNPKKSWRSSSPIAASSADVAPPVPKKRRLPRQRHNHRPHQDQGFVDEADVAVTLMMLSRDVTGWGDQYSSGGRFECGDCKKVFDSYQALGGHRASYKRLGSCGCGGESSADTEASSVPKHLCGVCGKGFASGQALGGHKSKKHFVGVAVKEEVVELLDLNLPVEAAAEGAWWIAGNVESEPVVAA